MIEDLGIAESGLRRWMAQSDINNGKKPGLVTDERVELARLRRENCLQAMEIEILKRVSAYFARKNVLPKLGSGSSAGSPLTDSPSR